MSATQLVACGDSELVAEKSALPAPWWGDVSPVVIDGDQFYGDPCSVTRVSVDDAGVTSAIVIFTVPRELLTICAQIEPKKNYLEYDGEFVILNVDRQTFGAGSWTGERYRSADFISWQRDIGVTWLNGEEYEAWRNVGSKSAKADAIKKVEHKEED
ncbi:hypothetical protein [Paraglaciecola sp.]|uniref:hypothetical protein n=1 Tax=Paraglaciecola sp. TaxID=1920173 RepID=UPI0030F3F11B